MDQPEAMRPQTEGEGSPSGGGPPAKTLSAHRVPTAVPTVPDYDLLRRIGGGAYGEVWLARSKATGALRAAKIVWRHTFEDERPFQREFEGIQRFEKISREHPSQLSLFHIGRNDAEGYFYYIMELADNRGTAIDYTPHTLRADLERGRLPCERVLELGLALAEALGHLHSNGLIHRDVKPSNVIFVNGRPKLADIGLVTDASDSRSIVGTEGYLSPEALGSPQADIFALGKVIYEAATGLDRREFPRLPEDLRSWPDARQMFELNEVLLRACATDAGQRYKTAEAMLGELSFLHDGKSVRRKRTIQAFWLAGKKAGIALGAVAAIAAIIDHLHQSTAPTESSDGPDSTNMEANAYCDKGLLILRGDNYTEVGAAYGDFTNAIAHDPNFARPYVGLLELRVREDVNNPALPDTTVDDLRSIAQHLEHLEPRLPANYIAQAAIHWSQLEFPEAERCIKEAIKANPNYEFAHTWYSWLLDCYGRTDEALAQLEISRTKAPSKVIVLRCFGNTYYVARNHAKAIEWYQKTINWEPHHFVAWNGIARSLLALGDYTNALPYFERSEVLSGAEAAATRQRYALLRRALDEQGIRGFWMQQWKWAEADTNADLVWKAEIQMHFGNTNAALDLLEKAYATHRPSTDPEPSLAKLLFDHDLDCLHQQPRFRRLLDEIGYTKVMRPGNK